MTSSSCESTHSVYSQDTESIDEHNVSSNVGSSNSSILQNVSMCARVGSLDQSLYSPTEKTSSTNQDVYPGSSQEIPLTRPEVACTKENSSSSPHQILNTTNDSSGNMVKKIKSPGYHTKGLHTKAFSAEVNRTDNLASSAARILELEAENRRLQDLLSNRRRDEPKEASLPKDHHHKIAMVKFSYDDNEGEITSISIKQMSKTDVLDHKDHRLSSSSGSGYLADNSGSETSRVPVPRINYTTSSSSSSSGPPSIGQFRLPAIPKKSYWQQPKSCVCHCFCSTFFDFINKETPEITSCSSLESTEPHSQDLMSLSVDQHTNHPGSTQSEHESQVPSAVPGHDSSPVVFRSRASVYIAESKNLPVFAKWPSNSFWYPGIVSDATEETWHTSTHLEVKFCDGTVRRIHSENLFPADNLPDGTEISFEKDGVCETAKLISIQRLVNNEVVCHGEVTKGFRHIENIPFEKIFLSNYSYKELKKSKASSLTPRKTPRFSVSTRNLTEGKRSRKTINDRSISKTIVNSPALSSGKKARPRLKRMRSLTDTSGSDVKRKKRKVGSQKKSTLKKLPEDTSTPAPIADCEGQINKPVIRKLYPDSPGEPCCSRATPTVHQTVDSNDSETCSDEFSLEEVYGLNLDPEKVLNVLQPTKSTFKRSGRSSKAYNIKGPIPKNTQIFAGYNFVLTQSTPKPIIVKKPSSQQYTSSEEGPETDYEDYYSLPNIPFDAVHLKEQIIKGGGKIRHNIHQIPVQERSKTILITDNVVETPKYLMAVSLGIPIYRHDLIIDCCLQNKDLSELLKDAMKMPPGRSLTDNTWVLNKAKAQPLAGYFCALILSGHQSLTKYFWHILTNMGAKVIIGFDAKNANLLCSIIGDDGTSQEVINLAKNFKIPVVSTVWVTQTLINGKLMAYNDHPLFSIHQSSD